MASLKEADPCLISAARVPGFPEDIVLRSSSVRLGIDQEILGDSMTNFLFAEYLCVKLTLLCGGGFSVLVGGAR